MHKGQSKLLLILIALAAFSAAIIIEYLPQKERSRTPFVKSAVKPAENGSSYDNSGKLDINTATKDELIKLNGIGEKLADRIIKYRENNGGFEAIEELANVPGIGEKTVDKLRDRICVR